MYDFSIIMQKKRVIIMSSGPTAVVRIKAAYRDMGAKDKEIANYVLSNLQEVSRSSISDLSSHLDMADSTIFQFTKRLGYEGFRDFKIALLTEENDPQEKVSGAEKRLYKEAGKRL